MRVPNRLRLNRSRFAAAFDRLPRGKVLDSLNGIVRKSVRILRLQAMCLKHGAIYRASTGVIEIRKGMRCIRLSSKHVDFVPDMVKYFDEYAATVVGANGVVDYSRPGLHRYAASGLEFELSSFPEEQTVIDDHFYWYTPAPGDLLFDVGAYCGVSTYHLSKSVGDRGRVIAFEPDPLNFRLLVRNCQRHSLANVTALQVAIAGSSGKALFNGEGTLGSGISRNIDRASAGDTIDVETITLEEACRRYGVPQFIKMDVEGAEIEVIQAARNFLRQHSIHFTLDTNHHANGALTASRVEQLFADSGYESHSSDKSGFMTTWARPLAVSNNQPRLPQ